MHGQKDLPADVGSVKNKRDENSEGEQNRGFTRFLDLAFHK
jgi:hypothetical protein